MAWALLHVTRGDFMWRILAAILLLTDLAGSQTKDGSLLVSDDANGMIYRVAYSAHAQR